MKGQKYTDDIKEKAYLMYDTLGNIEECARRLSVPASTLSGWLKKRERDSPDEVKKARLKKRLDFVEQSSELIDLAFDKLRTKLEGDDDIPANHLTTVIGTLYDKRALAKGESTQNTHIEFKLPKEVDDYAE